MSSESKHIDQLFEKARNAEVKMRVDQVAKVVAATTVVGSLAALLTKSKIIIMLTSTLTVATVITVVALNQGPAEAPEKNPEVIQTAMVAENDQPSETEEPVLLAPVEEPEREIVFRDEETEQVELEHSRVEKIEQNESVFINGEPLSALIMAPQEMKEMTYFNAISLSINADVELKKSGSCGAELHNNDLAEYLKIEVRNQTLHIGVKHGKEREFRKAAKGKEIRITVNMKELKRVDCSGSGSIHSADAIPSDQLELNMAGSGDILLEKITAEKWEANLSGSGDIVLGGNGNAEEGEVNIAGSGDVLVKNLSTKNVEVNISGSGDAVVNASDKLDASIAGNGDICNRGSGKTSLSCSGSGSIRKDCN